METFLINFEGILLREIIELCLKSLNLMFLSLKVEKILIIIFRRKITIFIFSLNYE